MTAFREKYFSEAKQSAKVLKAGSHTATEKLVAIIVVRAQLSLQL